MPLFDKLQLHTVVGRNHKCPITKQKKLFHILGYDGRTELYSLWQSEFDTE